MRLEGRAQAAFEHIAPIERRHLHRASLHTGDIRAGTKPTYLERLDPCRTRQEPGTAEPRMGDGGAVERIGVGLVRSSAPDLARPGARSQRNQLPHVDRCRQQRNLGGVQ